MRYREFTREDAQQVRAEIIKAVKQTDDERLLNKVYSVLRSTDFTSRLQIGLSADPEGRKYLELLTKTIVDTEGTVEEKLQFAEQFVNGFIDIEVLLSGEKVNFSQFISNPFAQRVFVSLLPITGKGSRVGPGEIALALLSPQIKKAAKGDLDFGPGRGIVEVKTKISKGGRLLDVDKSRASTYVVKKAIEKILGTPISERVNTNQWIALRDQIRTVDPKQVGIISQQLADATFSHVDNTQYAQALANGDAKAVLSSLIATGFADYKVYNPFEGILFMNAIQQTAHYIQTVEQLLTQVHTSTAYVIALSTEMMPQMNI